MWVCVCVRVYTRVVCSGDVLSWGAREKGVCHGSAFSRRPSFTGSGDERCRCGMQASEAARVKNGFYSCLET